LDIPAISAIVRTFNVADCVAETLHALREQDYGGRLEILVVDSGSTDGTLEVVEPLADRVLQLPGAYMPGRSLNRAAEAAQGEVLLLVSADATPQGPDAVRTLIEPLGDPAVAVTYGRHCPRPGASPSQARDDATRFPADGLGDPATRFSAAFAALRRTVWQGFPFDESYRAAEDVEWARRVSAAGHRIDYVPAARVLHSHRPTMRDIYARARRQRRTLATLDPQAWRFTAWHGLRFWLGISALDWLYALNHRYSIRWFFHIPLYRGAQAWGLYRGAREAQTARRS
jgi:rhamnosyltransferase